MIAREYIAARRPVTLRFAPDYLTASEKQMGISECGLIGPHVAGMGNEMLGDLLGCKLHHVAASLASQPDLINDRKHVILATGPRFHCIINDEFASGATERAERHSYDRYVDITGVRDRVMFFCAADSTSTYGFALWEDGQLIRRRFYSSMNNQRLVEDGERWPIERRWKPAILTDEEKELYGPEEVFSLDFFRNDETNELSTEGELDANIVSTILSTEFGYSPRPRNDTTRYEHYGSVQSLVLIPAELHASPQSWWRRRPS